MTEGIPYYIQSYTKECKMHLKREIYQEVNLVKTANYTNKNKLI